MSFKYYDLLSNLTVGLVVFYVIWKLLFPNWEISEWVVIPAGYVLGYFLNAISSLIEPLLFKTICGKPSDNLLTPVPGKQWTGIRKVRFYFPVQAVEELKKDTGDDEATTDKMFGYAMRVVNSNKDNRVSDFNGNYALSRVVLTTAIFVSIVVECMFYDIWYSWLLSLSVLMLSWNRFKESAYYYAKEVLTEYLKLKK